MGRETTTEAGRIVSDALDAFNGGDSERFLGFFAEDMRFWMVGGHPMSGTVETRAGFIELVGRVAAGLSEMITLDVINFLEAGDWVVIEAQGSAKTTAGTPYNNRYCMLWRVAGGKIVDFKEYNDSALVEATFFS